MKQTIIILEGHDTSGKSHIAAALSKELQIPVYKAVRNKKWWDPMVNLLYFTEGITQFIEQSKASCILDRWMPSDYMYSMLFNRDISLRKIWDLDERFANMDAVLIVCFKDKDKQIHDKEDEEFVNESQYDEMTRLYREYAAQSQIRKILFLNTSDENLEDQINKITQLL